MECRIQTQSILRKVRHHKVIAGNVCAVELFAIRCTPHEIQISVKGHRTSAANAKKAFENSIFICVLQYGP